MKEQGKCFIIAEAGVNHNGRKDLALQLCDAAKSAGADAVKFQIFKASKLVTKNAKKADYQSQNDKASKTQYEMLKKLSLSENDFIDIANYCSRIGIMFLATAFDEESLDFLFKLNSNIVKVPSGEITNLPYLIKISKMWNKIILSTGMATFDEIKAAFDVLTGFGAEVIVLHCTTEYPAPFDTINLRAMKHIGEKLNIKYGYSDHSEGIEVSIAAVALGATVIEKHFTLDRNMEGPDHKASIEADELKLMVNSIRNIEKSLGTEEKIVNECEAKNRLIVRKSIVAKKRIKKGELLTSDNITTKRPGDGLSPMMWFKVLGTLAKKDFEIDDYIVL